MKTRTYLTVALLVMVVSLTFVGGASAVEGWSDTSQVDVEVGQEINVQTTVINGGGGDGKDKYKGSAYMGVPLPGMVNTPNIPVSKGGHWRQKSSKNIITSLPDTIKMSMIDVFYANKLKFVEGDRKKKLAKQIAAARKKMLFGANIGVYYDITATSEIHPSEAYPGSYAKKGKDYLAMGSLTFQTHEELLGFWRELFSSGSKTNNVTSDDLAAMIAEIGMKLGADIFVPMGSGAETIFGTKASGINAGALVAGAMGLSTGNALPLGGALATGAGGTSGNNAIKANPYLTVALVKVKNVRNVLISLGRIKVPGKIVVAPIEKKKVATPAPVKVTKPVSEVKTLKRDDFLTLAMCAKPVPTPNGVTRLQVAEVELAKFIASENTDLEALSVFQSHMAQGIRDNIKGENLKMAQKGIVLAWIERSKVIKRAFEAKLINQAEFSKAHTDNIAQAVKAMEKYRLAAVPDLGVYSSMLKMHNSTYSAVK